MAKDDCASLTTNLIWFHQLVHPANNVKLYQMSGVYGASPPQDKTADLKVTSLANGSCDIEFNPASGGNMVTIEVKVVHRCCKPTGKIFDPAISKNQSLFKRNTVY